MKALLTLLLGFGLVFAGLVSPANAAGDMMLTRTYNIVSADKFVAHLKQLEPPKKGESNQDLLARYFKENHLEIKAPATMTLDEEKNRLYVHMTQPEQEQLEVLIQKIINTK